jgi:ribonuclease HII
MVERSSEVEGQEPPPRDDRAEYENLKDSTKFILGADECGLGSWAGPLVTCAVAVPRDWRPPFGLNDSKKLGPKKREQLFEILRNRIPYACEMAQSDEIDRVGITLALRRCFRSCIENVLARAPEALIVIDGEVRIPGMDHLRFPKADGIVPAVMAASVIGKVLHDRYMWLMAEKFPGYNFHKNQGYGTKDHQAGLEKLGSCPIHRQSYLPLQKLKTAEAMREGSDRGMVVD